MAVPKFGSFDAQTRHHVSNFSANRTVAATNLYRSAGVEQVSGRSPVFRFRLTPTGLSWYLYFGVTL
jgi:hypothetical protein